jgi:hypothetical protein
MASSTSSTRALLGGGLILVAALLAVRWRTLERSTESAERRAAELEKRTLALAQAVGDLQGRPATERVIMRERAPDREVPAASPGSAAAASGDSPVEETKEAVARRKREVYEKLERQFKDEPVDAVWARKSEKALGDAMQALPAGLGDVESTVSKSQHTRIEASFATSKEYNQFFRSLFTILNDPENPDVRRLPLYADHGGVFTPYKEVSSDGRFHAVIFVDRSHAQPDAKEAP